jgi:Spy/CpxP family protein refolding chaperone
MLGLGLLIFACGAVIGSSLVLRRVARRIETGRDPIAMQGRLLGSLKDELKLTDEQQAKVKAIFDQHRPAIDAARKAVAEEFGKTTADVDAVLSPEQRKELQAMIARWRSPFAGGGDHHHGNKGPHPGGPPPGGALPPPGGPPSAPSTEPGRG